MAERNKEQFSELFLKMVDITTNPDEFNRREYLMLLRQFAEYYGIAKASSAFYKSASHEAAGDGESLIGYDNGKATSVVLSRRIVTKTTAIIIGTIYGDENTGEFSDEDMKNMDLILRTVLSFVSRNRLQRAVEDLGFYDEYHYKNIRYFIRYITKKNATKELGGKFAFRLNLRHFSLVNKDIGRAAGDRIMRNYVSVLEEIVGSDGVVCRIGGDNFIGLGNTAVLDKVIEAFKGVPVNYTVNGENGEEARRTMISATAGVFVMHEGFFLANPDDIMDKLAVTSISAKIGSRDGILFYDDSVEQETEKTKRIQSLFPGALKNREFRAYYQPKVDVQTGEIVGAEALCRWFRDGEMIMPAQFIPVLEQNSDICLLDFYMLDSVCRDIRRWMEEKRSIVKISVNLSRKHLMNIDLLSSILGIIDKYGVPHEYIEMELTETTTDVEFDNLKRVVELLHKEKISTSVDDFGMGYSSLNLIRQIPWDVLKVDRSFLPADTDNDRSVTNLMLKHVISMTYDLGLDCIAEGVETPAQVEILRKNHCRVAQGFFYDRPLPVEEFEWKLDGYNYYDK